MYKPPYKGNRTYTVHTKIYQIETSPHRGCNVTESLQESSRWVFLKALLLFSSVCTEVARKSCLESCRPFSLAASRGRRATRTYEEGTT